MKKDKDFENSVKNASSGDAGGKRSSWLGRTASYCICEAVLWSQCLVLFICVLRLRGTELHCCGRGHTTITTVTTHYNATVLFKSFIGKTDFEEISA